MGRLNEVSILLKPLKKDRSYLKKGEELQKKIDFIKAVKIFDMVSEGCKDLEFQDFPEEFSAFID